MASPALHQRTLEIGPTSALLAAPGATERLPDVVRGLAADPRVFLVTDPGLVRAGVAGTVSGRLDAAGIPCDVYDAVEPNPTTATVDAGIDALAERVQPGTVVVAVGGGSAMDTAKGLAMGVANACRAGDLDYRLELARPSLPVVAVPTTAGTGSETNGWGVLTDADSGRKHYVGHVSAQPRVAVLDAELLVGLPPAVSAATGIDALTHAIESLCARHASPYADPIALGAIRAMSRWLLRAVQEGGDLEARAQTLLGAHLAGVAMSTGTGQGLAHAIGHALSSRLGTPHGVALAAVLPAVMAFNVPVAGEPLARVADALGVAQPGARDADNAGRAVAAVDELRHAVGAAPRLAALGVTDELVPTIVADALADVVLVNNPRQPREEELAGLIRSLL